MANTTTSKIIGCLLGAALCSAALSWGQSFEPIEGGFDVQDAVALPPPPVVTAGSVNTAQPGPAVRANSENTTLTEASSSVAEPVPANQTATGSGSMVPVETLDNIDFSSAVAAQPSQQAPINNDFQQQQLMMQEQQLRRIERVEEGLNKLVKKQSFSKSIMGTILSAATTADPVLAAIGGIAGFLIGKAEDYKQAEKKNYDIQQDILRKSPGFYTDEELKLAAYADLDLDPAMLSVDQIRTYANYVVEAKTRRRADGSYGPGGYPGSADQPGFMVASRQGHTSAHFTPVGIASSMPQLPEANYADLCYGHMRSARSRGADDGDGITNASVVTKRGNSQAVSALDRRNLARYCFYSLR